jgi:hypothetical protein
MIQSASGGSRDQTGLRPYSLQNGNIRGDGRPISASTSATRESGDEKECAKSPDSGSFSRLLGSLAERRNGGWAEGIEPRDGDSKADALACREDLQNPILSEFIGRSKYSNFENRTESAESRALEKNGPFGEERAVLPD